MVVAPFSGRSEVVCLKAACSIPSMVGLEAPTAGRDWQARRSCTFNSPKMLDYGISENNGKGCQMITDIVALASAARMG